MSWLQNFRRTIIRIEPYAHLFHCLTGWYHDHVETVLKFPLGCLTPAMTANAQLLLMNTQPLESIRLEQIRQSFREP